MRRESETREQPENGDVARRLLAHYRATRRDLPWRRTRDPYAVWVSEIMLQQTRVATVIPYYERWLERFPTVAALADAPLDDVLERWSGLGYYSRARNLHRGAHEVMARWGGALPRTARELREVPGIGRYTAGAIASIAHGEPTPLVDGNVARVLARHYGIDEDVKSTVGQKRLWALAESLVPAEDPGDFNQALMELGAMVCTPRSPDCDACPLAATCVARAAGRTAELPVLPPRKRASELPRLDRAAAWVVEEGRVLLVRRRPDGLYGGLWELPQAERRIGVGNVVRAPIRLRANAVHTHEQTLSHRRMRVRVWRGRMTGPLEGVADDAYDDATWQPLDAIERRGVSSATLEIARQMTEQ